MAQTYESVQNMTDYERFDLARSAYVRLQGEHPDLESSPGDMAAKIKDETGVDFETAAIVALSVAIGR